jgi:hypothetical protein
MKTTKELIIADITAKVEAKLAKHEVQLSNIVALDEAIVRFNKSFGNYMKELPKLKSLAKSMDAYGKEFVSAYRDVVSLNRDIEIAFNNLGVKPSSNETMKKADKVLQTDPQSYTMRSGYLQGINSLND